MKKVFIILSIFLLMFNSAKAEDLPFVGTRYFNLNLYPHCETPTCVSYQKVTITKRGLTTISEVWKDKETTLLYKDKFNSSGMYNMNYGYSFVIDNDDNLYLTDDNGDLVKECYLDKYTTGNCISKLFKHK